MFNLLLFLKKKAVLSSCSLRMRNQKAPVISGASVRSLLVTKDGAPQVAGRGALAAAPVAAGSIVERRNGCGSTRR
jgi:hypothetical protein